MFQLKPPSEEDLQHLKDCLELDKWHRHESYETWINAPGGLVTLSDDAGPVFHMAFTEQGKTLRLHAQFDPRERMRTARGVIFALGNIKALAAKTGIKTLALWSESPKMIRFMEKLGFKKEGEDYTLQLGV